MHKPIGILFVLMAFVSACPAPPVKTIPPFRQRDVNDPQAEEQFDRGVTLFESGQMEESAAVFQAFIDQYGDSRMGDQARVYLGRIAMQSGDHRGARAQFDAVSQGGRSSSVVDYAQLFRGETLFREGRYRDAIDVLSDYVGRFPSEEDNRRVVDLLWRSGVATDETEHIGKWGELKVEKAVSAEERRDILSTIEAHLAQQTDTEALLTTATRLKDKGAVWARVMGRVLLLQYQNGNRIDAAQTLLEIRESGAESSFLGPLEEAVAAYGDADMRTVGVLLPVSGTLRVIGQSALKGAMLGARKYRFGEDGSPVSIVIKDTGDKEAQVSELVKDLVEKDKVGAIVGPVDAVAAKEAAAAARQFGVPLILLTPDENIAKRSEYLFRKFSSNRLEVEALYRHYREAVDMQRRDAKMAILYPDNGYGRIMKDLFEARLKADGTTWVTAVPFAPETTDFTQLASQIARDSFFGLFLPVTARQMALLSPYLAAAGVWPDSPSYESSTDPQNHLYLLSSVAMSESVIARAGKYLQGARVAAGLNAAVGADTERFMRTYANEYKSTPSIYAAYAYDAVVILAEAIRSGVDSRFELRDWLSHYTSDTGLSLPFSGFDSDGEAIAPPPILKLEGTVLNPTTTPDEWHNQRDRWRDH